MYNVVVSFVLFLTPFLFIFFCSLFRFLSLHSLSFSFFIFLSLPSFLFSLFPFFLSSFLSFFLSSFLCFILFSRIYYLCIYSVVGGSTPWIIYDTGEAALRHATDDFESQDICVYFTSQQFHYSY